MKKIAIAILLSTFVAPPAVADLYTGIKLGRVDYKGSEVKNSNRSGYGLLYGNTITKNFSVEGEFANLGGYASATDDVTGTEYSLSAIGFYPLKPSYSFFGKMGVVSITFIAKPKSGVGLVKSRIVSNAGLMAGFGYQYNVGRAMDIRVGIDSYAVKNVASNSFVVHTMYVCSVFKF